MKKILFLALAIILAVPGLSAPAKKKKLSYGEKLENRVHELINAERKKKGLPALKKSSKLSEIARAHSRDMAKNNYTSHINLKGQTPSKRAKAAGFNIEKKTKKGTRVGVGENIFEAWSEKTVNGKKTPYLNTVENVAKNVIKGWMESPGHRKNVLDKSYTTAGTGVAISKDKRIKVTQLYF